jgi:asparagine synthase (glutamine-hydrolysing)
MCGLAGLSIKNKSSLQNILIEKMMKAIKHRGSGNPSYYYYKNVSLGHCSSKVFDKEQVTQPITYKDSGLFLLFDGIIYNNNDLRQELLKKGYSFFSNSIPETILLSYIEYGCEALEKFNGTWALAIYSSLDGSFFLARDRFGGKPLYFYADPDHFAFASEYKAFLSVSELLNMDLDMRGFHTALCNNLSVLEASGKTLFKNIHNILPGHFISIKNNSIISKQWLDLNKNSQALPDKYNDQCELFFELLKRSCHRIKAPGAPAALLLSSGLDSFTLSNIFKQNPENNIRNFSIPEKRIDTNKISQTVHFFKKEHLLRTIITFDKKDLLENMENIIFYTENIQFVPSHNNYFIHKKIKEAGYDISIAGHGADELLGGYPWNLIDLINTYHLQKETYTTLFKKFEKYNCYLASASNINFIKSGYQAYSFQPLKLPDSFSPYKKNLAIGLYQSVGPYGQKLAEPICSANKIESRCPYLDNQLANFALLLPDKSNFSPDNNKKVLIDINKIFLKNKYTYRHKIGFSNLPEKFFADIDEWIKEIIYSDEYKLEIIDKKELGAFYKNKVKKRKCTYREKIVFWRSINALKLSNIFANFKSIIN